MRTRWYNLRVHSDAPEAARDPRVNPGLIMSNINTEKTRRVIDSIICAAMSAIYPYIAWTSGKNIDASFAIRIALILWLTIILARGMRLLQYMASFDIDLARYAERDLDSIEISFKYKFRAWKTYLKEPFRKARPFYIIFFLIYLLHMFLKFSEVVYFVVANLFLFAFITIVILSAANEISKYIANFHSKYNTNETGQSKTEIATCLKRGFLTGAAFVFF